MDNTNKPSEEYPNIDDIDDLEGCLISIPSSDDDPKLLVSESKNKSLSQVSQNSVNSETNRPMAGNQLNSDLSIKKATSQVSIAKQEDKKGRKSSDDDEFVNVQLSIDFDDSLMESIREPTAKIGISMEEREIDCNTVNIDIQQPEKAYEQSAQSEYNRDQFLKKAGIFQQDYKRQSIESPDHQRDSVNRMSFSDCNEDHNYSENGSSKISFSDFNADESGGFDIEDSNHESQSTFSKGKYETKTNQFKIDNKQIDFWGPGEKVEKSNIQVNINQSDCVFDTEENQEAEIIDFNKSMIAQKIKPRNCVPGSLKNSTPQKKCEKQLSEKKIPKDHINETEDRQYLRGMEESLFMQPARESKEKEQNRSSFGSKSPTDRNLKSSVNVQSLIEVVQMDDIYFIKNKNNTYQISEKLVNRIAEYFLSLGIMIPLFNLQLMEAHKEKKINEAKFYENQMEGLEKSIVQKKDSFTYYLERYFQYLVLKHTSYIKELLKDLKKLKLDGKASSIAVNSVKKGYGSSFGDFFNKFTDYFKKRPYSKAQILKDSLQSKLQCLSYITEDVLSPLNIFQNGIAKTKSEKEISSGQNYLAQCSESKKLKFESSITNLQMLISFEHAELYCEKKLEESLEQNIWKERKLRLIKDRNWFIDNMFQQILI